MQQATDDYVLPYESFNGKNILVTGGTGTVGSEIVRQLLKYKPKVIRIYSRDETKQFDLKNQLREHGKKLRFLIGNIRDEKRLYRALEGIDIVFHAAALKHVESCEYNPFEAIKTNIIGTQNVIEASIDLGIEKVIMTSSDKAVNPSNVMGASKLMAERLMTAGNYIRGGKDIIISSVRFGNILGSRGSVIPLFEQQIKAGGPITITEPSMTRFIMSLSQSVNLVFKATELAKGGELFIPKMPAFQLKDLAEGMIEHLAPRYGHSTEQIEIKTIGAKPGEKYHEELMTKEEESRALETEDMFIVLPLIREFHKTAYVYPNAWEPENNNYASDKAPLLSKRDILDLLF